MTRATSQTARSRFDPARLVLVALAAALLASVGCGDGSTTEATTAPAETSPPGLAALPLADVPDRQSGRGVADAVPAGLVAYTIDAGHTGVFFKIRHLGIATVTGRFDDVAGEVAFDPDAPEGSTVDVVIQAASFATSSPDRDEHVMGPDWFDAAAHPTLRFTADRMEAAGAGRYRIPGTLTIKGVARPVTLDAVFNGAVPAANDGQPRAGFEATAVVDRTAYGIGTTQSLPGGVVDLDEEVRIVLEVELLPAPDSSNASTS